MYAVNVRQFRLSCYLDGNSKAKEKTEQVQAKAKDKIRPSTWTEKTVVKVKTKIKNTRSNNIKIKGQRTRSNSRWNTKSVKVRDKDSARNTYREKGKNITLSCLEVVRRHDDDAVLIVTCVSGPETQVTISTLRR